MLTARVLTSEDAAKSHKKGAVFYIPKEQLIDIVTFLGGVLKAREKGKNPWGVLGLRDRGLV